VSRSSGRAQVEPVAALVAVAVVSLAVGLYTGVLDSALPGQQKRHVPETALSAVEDHVAPAGVVRSRLVSEAPDSGPTGYRTNVTVTAGERRWTAGPVPPRTAGNATGRVSVRTAPARVVAGRLRVAVWR